MVEVIHGSYAPVRNFHPGVRELAESLLTDAVGVGGSGGGSRYKDGGANVAPVGYAVGGRVESFVIGVESEPWNLKAHGIADSSRWFREAVDKVAAWIQCQPAGCDVIGSWLDYDGRVWFDVSDIIADRDEAVNLGTRRGELAIYDLAAGAEIDCQN